MKKTYNSTEFLDKENNKNVTEQNRNQNLHFTKHK